MHFRQETFVADIVRILNETGVEGRCLAFEITESVLMENIEETIGTLQQLNTLGIEIIMDDFGTGYSSLSYLRRYHINSLKIDHSFVRDLSVDQAIIAAILAMAHGLKIKVIAEGVESQDQLSFLVSHGCSQFQGHYFSEPLLVAEFESRMWKSKSVDSQLPRWLNSKLCSEPC
jgi:EAL domain-containing protein (putative c-di-GMP-specific phosphodiesterase class I)